MRKTDLEWCNILEVLEDLAFPSSLGVLSHPKLKRTNKLLKGLNEALMDSIVSTDVQKLWFHKNHVGIHKITAWSHLNSNFTLGSRHTRQTLKNTKNCMKNECSDPCRPPSCLSSVLISEQGCNNSSCYRGWLYYGLRRYVVMFCIITSMLHYPNSPGESCLMMMNS